uniref:Calmodulin n=1 Tax=Mesocestoides corti TaxID=53468 RepID=A0A5K3EY18_MESCO
MPGSPSEESLEELREVFALFDRDHNGYMSLSELKTMMKQFNRACTTDEAKEIFSSLDKNNDGRIDFREFVALMQPLMDEAKGEDFYFKIAFAFFDKNDDGNITTGELRQVLHNLHLKLTDSEIDDMITEADLDRNGTISYEEFLNMMSKSHA